MTETPINPFEAPAVTEPMAPFEEPDEWAPDAELGHRWLARFLDNIILFGAAFVAALAHEVLVGLVVLAVVGGQSYLITTRGQTLGKMALKIQIVHATTGQLPGFVFGVLLREWLFFGAGMIVPFLGVVDALFIFRSDHRCLHDLLAQTRVVPVQVTYSVD